MTRVDYEAIRAKRIELDITQKDLSERSGVNVNIIKQVETGRSNTDEDNLRAICEVLGLNLDDVYHKDFHDTRVVAVLNNKGGCGKTSLCCGVGSALAEQGYRVLLIDSDAQRNLSSSFDMPRTPQHFGKAVLQEESLLDYIQPTKYAGIDMIVADVSMGMLDMNIFTKVHRENIVRSILQPVVEKGWYDYVLIDTNPNLSLLNFNVVNACDYCIIPVQPAGFDVDGLGTVVEFIQGVAKYNPKLKIAGIVINRYDARSRIISETAVSQLQQGYGELLFDTKIQVDSKLQASQWENVPVLAYTNSRITKEYRALSKEIVKRCM